MKVFLRHRVLMETDSPILKVNARLKQHVSMESLNLSYCVSGDVIMHEK